MSCFYQPHTQENIKNFLKDLNTFLRERNYYFEFSTGTLYHHTHGYCGPVEDDKHALLLVDELSGEILYETNEVDDK